MEVINTLSQDLPRALEALVGDVVTSRVLGGLTDDERESLRIDLETIEHVITADENEPHIMLVGEPDLPVARLLEHLVFDVPIDLKVKESLGRGRWYPYETAQGTIHLLDARGDDAQKGLRFHPPDAIVGLVTSGNEDVSGTVDALLSALYAAEDGWDVSPPTLVAIHREDGQRDVADFRTQQALKTAFVDAGLTRDAIDVVQLCRDGRLSRALVKASSDEVRFSLARMSPHPSAKRELAQTLIRLSSSINASIATIPLPVGSTVPITSIQVVMIGGIAYLSGRDLSVRTIAEFAAAMGLNVGAGLALREIARALVQLIPVAGSLVSASIAAGATTTVGNAAVRYFID